MIKVERVLGDGTKEEYWEDQYDGCIYGYKCDKWSLQDAVRQFYHDVRHYKTDNGIK